MLEGIQKARIFHDVVPKKTIDLLKAYYSKKPHSLVRWVDEQKGILQQKEKHNDYNVSNGIVHKVLYPVLQSIVGEHTQCSGSWAEIHRGVSLHVDSNIELADYYSTGAADQNLGILIPLTEGERHQTVFFDYFTEDFNEHSPVPTDTLPVDHTMFGHLTQWMLEKVKHIPIDKIFNYKVGDIVVWDRRQLHCAVDLPKGTSKTHIGIFC